MNNNNITITEFWTQCLQLLQDEVSAENLYNAYKNCDYEKFSRACADLREYLKFGSAKNVANLLKFKQEKV